MQFLRLAHKHKGQDCQQQQQRLPGLCGVVAKQGRVCIKERLPQERGMQLVPSMLGSDLACKRNKQEDAIEVLACLFSFGGRKEKSTS